MTEKPKQVDGLDITPVDDGFIIYVAEKDRVHYLNHTAALVLVLIDGQTTTEGLARLVQQQFALDEAPTREVDAIIEQFKDEGLIVIETG